MLAFVVRKRKRNETSQKKQDKNCPHTYIEKKKKVQNPSAGVGK